MYGSIGNQNMLLLLKSKQLTKNIQQQPIIKSELDNNANSSLSDFKSSDATPMESSTKKFMESRFNHDFSNVRIHKDAKSHEMVKNVGADAFTVGNEIFFGKDMYQQDSKEGLGLLAHELTHVIQQDGKRHNVQYATIESSTEYELEANSAAIAVLENRPVRVVTRVGQNPIQTGFWDTITSAARSVGSAIESGVEAVGGAVSEGMQWLAENVPIVGDIRRVFRRAGDVIGLILNDPIGFLGNLLTSVKGGFNQFSNNILTHLQNGVVQWLFGTLAEAGIEIPQSFDLKSIFGLILQVLGLTTSRLRETAVRLIGERNVAIFEKVWQYVSTLISEGPKGLWNLITQDASMLIDLALDSLKRWIIETVIKKAITKLVSMFSPVGAVIQALITIYDVVTFVIERAKQITELVDAVLNSVEPIARGNTGPASDWIERALGRTIPVAIGLLANLVGLGGLSNKIRETLGRMQERVWGVVESAIMRVIGIFRGKNEEPQNQEMSPEDRHRHAAGHAAIEHLKNEHRANPFDEERLSARLALIKNAHGFSKLEHRRDGDNWIITSAMSPDETDVLTGKDEGWPLGTTSDPIPMIWFKKSDDYEAISIKKEPDKDDSSFVTKSPNTGVQLSNGQVLKISPIRFLNSSTPPMTERGRVGDKGNKAKVRDELRNFGYPDLGKVQIDHVQDLNWNGDDDYDNLWPLKTEKNRGANAARNQQVRARDSEGKNPETKAVSSWRGKYFKIFKVRNAPNSPGDHGTTKDKPANMDENGKPIKVD